MAEDKSWAPSTREEWVELFADGNLRAGAKQAEEAAKEAAKNPPAPEEDKDKTPPKLSLGERLLGIRSE